MGIATGYSRTFPQYLSTILATLVAMAMGLHLSWPSAALPMLLDRESVLYITKHQGSWIASLITLGGCVGAIPAGTISMRLGPKRTLQIIALPLIAAWYIIAFSNCVLGLYIGRFLAGLGTGAACVATPMYITEVAEARIRGTLGTLFQLQITIGFLFGYCIGGIINNFQLLALTSSAVPVVFVLTFLFMPESPVYLISRGRIEEARKSLQYLRGTEYDVDDELSRIKENIEEATSNKGSLSDLLKCKSTLRAMVISLALMFFQQMSGINAVLFYAQPIFEESGSAMSPSNCAIVIGIVQVLSTYASTLLIDRWGRKILLVTSASVMAICLGILGAYFHLQHLHVDLSCCSFVSLGCVSIYLVAFSIGFGPIPWMMIGELFSPKVKGPASSLSATFNWMLAFTVTKLFQTMEDTIGSSLTFGAFAIISLIGAIFCTTMIPETKGKDLDEIQEMLAGKKLKGSEIDGYTSPTVIIKP